MNKLANDLDKIALGESYSASVLMQAIEHPAVTANDTQVLSRYIWGTESSTDHLALQQIAIYIREHDK